MRLVELQLDFQGLAKVMLAECRLVMLHFLEEWQVSLQLKIIINKWKINGNQRIKFKK